MRSSLTYRLGVYFVGILVLCFGVVLNTKTGLGVASINTIPYAVSQIQGVTLGTATFLLYVVFIAIQLIVRRAIDVKTLLQLPVSLLFGQLVDLFDLHVLTFEAATPLASALLLACAIACTALGTTLVVSMRLVPAAPDGIVQTLGDGLDLEFGAMKFRFDVGCIVLTALYSLVAVGHPVGIGIGTIAAMLFTGKLCTVWRRVLAPVLERVGP